MCFQLCIYQMLQLKFFIIWVRSYLFLKNYITSERAISHNIFYYQQLSIACYQVSLYSNNYFLIPVITKCPVHWMVVLVVSSTVRLVWFWALVNEATYITVSGSLPGFLHVVIGNWWTDLTQRFWGFFFLSKCTRSLWRNVLILLKGLRSGGGHFHFG